MVSMLSVLVVNFMIRPVKEYFSTIILVGLSFSALFVMNVVTRPVFFSMYLYEQVILFSVSIFCESNIVSSVFELLNVNDIF